MKHDHTSNRLGLALEDRIDQSRHETAGIAIWYIGQVGFLMQHRGLTIAIDPYLSDSVDRLNGFPKNFWVRNYPPPISPDKLRNLDLVLCTHDHMDHTDPETLQAIAAASPHCHFAGPRLSINEIHRCGIPDTRTTMLNEGPPFAFREVVIDSIAAAHEDYETDAEGYHRYLGYLLHWDGLTLFHAGDTVETPQLIARLAHESIDVGFLPINGGDDERRKIGVVGNMHPATAAKFAIKSRFDLVVPTHFDLYPNNTAEVVEFTSALEAASLPKPRHKIFLPGERLVCTKTDRSRELAVIIGAGKTGRGFLARLLNDSPFDIAFVDSSEELVRRINEDGAYSIHYFGQKRPPHPIRPVSAALIGSTQALDWMTRASVIFTAIGEQNITSLIPFLRPVLETRDKQGQARISLIVCENGASPAAPLRKAFETSSIEIAEAAIFCSTIELPGTRLDIQSEPYDALPFDAVPLKRFRALKWMNAVPDFPSLLKRKIYTYNCFSACIAYLGAFKGHAWYADAAQDPEIDAVLRRIAEPLNQAIAKRFSITIEEQRQFSAAALRKFSDATIRDDISRNARNVIRKLAHNDRLIAPALLILEQGGAIDALALVMAAALLYRGPEEKPLDKLLAEMPVSEVFQQISECPTDSEITRRVVHYYQLLQSGGSLLKILNSPA